MKPKKHGIEKPEPFYKISFECGNRSFYQVKSDLWETAINTGLDIEDGYYTENCDYEGDLEENVIYHDARGIL